MSTLRLLLRSLAFYRREHELTVLATAVAAAVLAGALVVGESLTATLAHLTASRLGNVRVAIQAGDRLFRERLVGELRQRLAPDTVAGVLALPGAAENDAGTIRAGRVQILGVDKSFPALALEPPDQSWEGGVFVSTALAKRLGVRAGDEILVRVEKPGRVSRDMALAVGTDTAVATRERIRGVLADEEGGRFSLRNSQAAPLNVYFPLDRLQELAGAAGQVNMVLASTTGRDPAGFDALLRDAWKLSDVGLEVWEVPEHETVELNARNVFLEDAVARAALALAPTGTAVFTYMVNAIEHGDRSTPYSFVCGAAALPGVGAVTNGLVATDWLAEDLALTNGASVRLRYYVMGADRALVETSAVAQVERIVPLAGSADMSLMPNIPGVAETGDCRDWHSGLPIDMKRIRPKDEAYWKQWRGTPKAYLPFDRAQALWATPWGRLTAVRWPAAAASVATVERELRQRLAPADFGLVFRDVAAEAQQSVAAAMDFRQLFLGLSLFLIVSAFMLAGLLFRLTLERRQTQAGLLMALGAGQVLRRWLMLEALTVAVAGSLLGVAGGVGYARAMVWGLAGVGWRGSVNGLGVTLTIRPATLVTAWSVTVLLALLVMGAGIRALRRRRVQDVLAGRQEESEVKAGGRRWGVMAVVSCGLALLLWGTAWLVNERSRAGLFFGVGALLLAGACTGLGWILHRANQRREPLLTTFGLGLREAGRQPVRSVLVSALMAAAMFLLVTVALSEPPQPARFDRGSGTGGFAWLAESAVPIHADLNTSEGQRPFGLAADELRGASFVGLHLHAADDASCLNLTRAQQPQVAGVDPRALAARGAFRFARSDRGAHPTAANGWERLLTAKWPPHVVPAVADEATLVWGLGLGVGDELTTVDGRGHPLKLHFVGMLESSVLQGTVIIDEARFARCFPGDTGYRAWLVDAPPARADAVGATLTTVFRREGMACESTVDRLGEFDAVTKAYLAMFRTLGGLGVVLGVAGLAVILARHVVERSGALALLRAVGFRRSRLVGLLVSEPMWLLGAGLLGGGGAAVIAMLPSLGQATGVGAVLGCLEWAFIVTAGGLIATWVAAVLVTRGQPFDALRDE